MESAEQPATPEYPDENEGQEYCNGFWIDGVVTADSGKKIAVILGGKQYADGEEGTVDGRSFIVDRSSVSSRLLPCEIVKPSEPKPIDPDEEDPAERIPEIGEYNEVTFSRWKTAARRLSL